MVGHLILADPSRPNSRTPATLSPFMIQERLRPLMGEEVIVISDDLDMGAIRRSIPLLDAFEAAVRAGNDLIIHANTNDHHPMLASRVVMHLSQVAMRDPAFLERIVEANRRLDGASWLD